MNTKNPLNAVKKEEIKRTKSLNKNAPKQLRESVVGELVDEHEKILLSDTMRALSYEDLGLHHAKGRDFAGPFVVHNAMRDVFAHLLHYTLGPLALFVLVPWLGKEVCRNKSFMYKSQTRHIYIGSLALSFTGPMLILYVVVLYLYKMPIRFVGFVDFFIPMFEIISILGVVCIKHGLMDKRNYLKRNYSKSKIRRMSSVPVERSFTTREQGAPLSIFVGMVGGGEIRRISLEREYKWTSKRILHFDQDYLQVPLGFDDRQGVVDKQIVHNKSNLKMDLGGNLCQKKVLFTKVKARHLGEAIISSCTKCNCNSNEMVCKTCKKNLPAISWLVRHVDFWSVIYIIARTVMLLFQAKFDLKLVLPIEWVILVVTMFTSFRGSRPVVATCGLAYCDFRRRRFFENRLAMLIHQMRVRSHKCVEAWERLRLSFNTMGKTYYRILQWYNAYLLFYFAFYFVAFSLLLVLDVNRSIPIYVKIVIASFGFYMEGVVLYGIRVGSIANRVGSHHTQEWLNVKSNLISELHDIKVQMRNVNRKKNVVDNSRSEPDPAEETTKDEGELQEQYENLNSAILSIDTVAKKLDSELMYGGIRLISVRLTKRFFKIIVVLYAYQIYYFLYIIIAIEYYADDMSDMVRQLS
eukprot:g14716.t1